ncbi:hypothetical protein TI10_11265 [Photorhabdus luminescens subsp. luminescens]|nr:hypothetical protein TI10_11265 [Photorhabdus luminescens subsp. luminescens]
MLWGIQILVRVKFLSLLGYLLCLLIALLAFRFITPLNLAVYQVYRMVERFLNSINLGWLGGNYEDSWVEFFIDIFVLLIIALIIHKIASRIFNRLR